MIGRLAQRLLQTVGVSTHGFTERRGSTMSLRLSAYADRSTGWLPTGRCFTGELFLDAEAWLQWCLGLRCVPGDERVTLQVSVPFVSLFLSPIVPRAWQRKFLGHDEPSKYHVKFYRVEGHTCVDLAWGAGPPAWGREDYVPEGYSRLFQLEDLFFGEAMYTESLVEERRVTLYMPEGSYQWMGRLQDDRWKRPRWPFAKVVRRAHMDAIEGEHIPFPDDSDYGIPDADGMDASYGFTAVAKTLCEGAEAVRAYVLKRREERGWDADDHRVAQARCAAKDAQ